jgi:hypothetical protein
MSEKVSNVGSGAVETLGGAVCLLATLIVLLQALVIALANAGLDAGWSSLTVVVVVAVLGVILLRTGRSRPRRGTPRPAMAWANIRLHVLRHGCGLPQYFRTNPDI